MLRTLYALAAVLMLSVFLVPVPHAIAASTLLSISDLLSTSAPGADPVSHTIQFTLIHAVPPSGTITLTPQAGGFNIPVDFGYNDVDFAIATSSGFVDQDLAAVPDTSTDGVLVTSGTNGAIVIVLNSTSGLSKGTHVLIKLGQNASYGGAGVHSIPNPAGISSYRIDIATADALGNTIDNASAMVAIVAQVGVSIVPTAVPPGRFAGLPSGELPSRNGSIEISLQTDELAQCRYSLTPNVSYDSMTGTFLTTNKTVFYRTLNGFQDATSYVFYVRCLSDQGQVNTDDYLIAFNLDPTAAIPTPGTVGSTAPPSVSGQGGIGPYPDGSAVLYQSTVTLSGWAPPSSAVSILKDGTKIAVTQAGSDGSFTDKIENLERNTYTFTMYATDIHALKSSSYASTIDVQPATNDAITNIVLPPTIAVVNDSVAIGDGAEVTGMATPGSTVQVVMTPRGGSTALGDTKLYVASSTKDISFRTNGVWDVHIPAKDLARGSYIIRARVVGFNQQDSDFSSLAYLGVGQPTVGGAFSKSDLNKDGKVNLIDFSILLASWGSATGDADINKDGTVNLGDVSIMLFDWTG